MKSPSLMVFRIATGSAFICHRFFRVACCLTDFDGVKRPQDFASDIGAYEHRPDPTGAPDPARLK
jgi:hypothetical protein